MEHAVFADLSDLQLLVTRFVYEDRAALPLSWRQALGFRHLLHAARAGLGRRPPASRHQRHARLAAPAPCERRSAASCGAALRDRQSAILGAARAEETPQAGPARRPPRTPMLAPSIATAVREGRALCSFDLARFGLGRVQIFIHRRGERVECAVLCAREARPLVTRALAEARALLARGGVRLMAPPSGEVS